MNSSASQVFQVSLTTQEHEKLLAETRAGGASSEEVWKAHGFAWRIVEKPTQVIIIQGKYISMSLLLILPFLTSCQVQNMKTQLQKAQNAFALEREDMIMEQEEQILKSQEVGGGVEILYLSHCFPLLIWLIWPQVYKELLHEKKKAEDIFHSRLQGLLDGERAEDFWRSRTRNLEWSNQHIQEYQIRGIIICCWHMIVPLHMPASDIWDYCKVYDIRG